MLVSHLRVQTPIKQIQRAALSETRTQSEGHTTSELGNVQLIKLNSTRNFRENFQYKFLFALILEWVCLNFFSF